MAFTSDHDRQASPKGGPLRVLEVVEACSGGTGRHVMDLATGLLAAGCEVHLAYADHRMSDAFSAWMSSQPSLRTTRIAVRRSIAPQDLYAAWQLHRYIVTNGPFDVVHGHSSKGGALARLGALGTGASVFYTMHGLTTMDRTVPVLRRVVYTTLEAALGAVTDRIIAVSPEETRNAAWLERGRVRLLTIPNGIDPSPLRAHEVARADLGLCEQAVLIGFVGRLVPVKAVDVLLRAFARVSVRGVPVHLLIIGTGPLEAELRRLSEECGVDGRVHWMGEQPADRFLAGMDVFAISSWKEGLPYVVLEAMAAGLPVVATAAAGIECLIIDGVNGSVVATGDADAFASALTHLAQNPQLRQRMSTATRQIVGNFSIDTMVRRTLHAYRSARNVRPARRSLGGHWMKTGGKPC